MSITDIKVGDKIVCKTEEFENKFSSQSIAAPKMHEIVTVAKVRIYGYGFCIALEEYDPQVFFALDAFERPDLDFADDLIKNLWNNDKT